ncbi:MAG: hypothetical protein AABO41_21095 [Acidobacteriota bacterium]
MTDGKDPKSRAWDLVGGMFWRLGRESARPSRAEIELFLKDINSRSTCCIIGATTKELIETAIERRMEVTVMDFSEATLEDLKGDMAAKEYESLCIDVLSPIPQYLLKKQRFILSDRLVNRFTRKDVPNFLRNALAVLAKAGELRITVKLGLYPMDIALIEEGRSRGTLKQFYDEETRTLDYAEARAELETRLLPHGRIPRDVLLQWYQGRGKESRFTDEDIQNMLAAAQHHGRSFTRIDRQVCPDAPNTILYSAYSDIRESSR